MDIILLIEWAGKKYGDIITVNSGLGNTMLNRGQAIAIEDYEDDNCISEEERHTIHYLRSVKENEEMKSKIENLSNRNDRLAEEVERLKEQLKPDPTTEKKAYYDKHRNNKLNL